VPGALAARWEARLTAPLPLASAHALPAHPHPGGQRETPRAGGTTWRATAVVTTPTLGRGTAAGSAGERTRASKPEKAGKGDRARACQQGHLDSCLHTSSAGPPQHAHLGRSLRPQSGRTAPPQSSAPVAGRGAGGWCMMSAPSFRVCASHAAT